MKRDFKLYLDDIIKYIDKAEQYTINFTYEDFLKDGKTSDAVIRCIEVLGEASNKIPEDIKNKYPIPWRDISNMRNRIIHGYFDVDLEEVWLAVKKDMKELKPLIIGIIKDYSLENKVNEQKNAIKPEPQTPKPDAFSQIETHDVSVQNRQNKQEVKRKFGR